MPHRDSPSWLHHFLAGNATEKFSFILLMIYVFSTKNHRLETKKGRSPESGNRGSERTRPSLSKESEAAYTCKTTESSLDSLFTSMATATDVLGVPLFREEMMTEFWPEQRRHIPCIQDPPGIQLYTEVGQIKKGGKSLPVYRCARGTSLESFHLHLARFIPGNMHVDYS